jgi:hypothetical protein
VLREAVAPGRWRGPPEAVVWLTAVMVRRPWVGLPATSRVHPWLGDRWVPSRRCAGGGLRPVCARSQVDCGSGRLQGPRLASGRRVRVSWMVVTRCSSSCKNQSATRGAAPDPRPAPAVRPTRASGRSGAAPYRRRSPSGHLIGAGPR